jgi:hypothetical protein
MHLSHSHVLLLLALLLLATFALAKLLLPLLLPLQQLAMPLPPTD